MAKTLNEWAVEIAKWADEKGWWEPQCKHPIANVRALPGEKLNWWCSLCGSVSTDNEDSWQLPSISAERNQGELHMLFITEIAESFEEIRNNHAVDEVYYPSLSDSLVSELKAAGLPNNTKPEGVPVEIAALLIRVLDWAGHYGIDLDAEIERKMKYNWTRPYRHGGLSA